MKNAQPHNDAELSGLDKRYFTGTDNPRHLRVIAGLLRSPQSRESIDSIAGCSNGPELIAELRRRGLDMHRHLVCQRIKFTDRDGRICRPGVYSLTLQGRRLIFAWLKRQSEAKHV